MCKIYTEADVRTLLARINKLEEAITDVLEGSKLDAVGNRDEDGLNFAVFTKELKYSHMKKWRYNLAGVLK